MQETKEQFIQYLKENNLKWSQQREFILDLFLSTEDHITADELYQLAQKKYPHIGYATVYRTLKLFSNCGIASSARFGSRFARYESAQKSHHHDHLICTECNTIVEFECEQIEKMQTTVARQNGFKVTHHKLELYGICESCRKKITSKH